MSEDATTTRPRPGRAAASKRFHVPSMFDRKVGTGDSNAVPMVACAPRWKIASAVSLKDRGDALGVGQVPHLVGDLGLIPCRPGVIAACLRGRS